LVNYCVVSDSTHPPAPAPFNEQAALAELEQLADKIQISRRQRERAEAEFDAFVKGFRYERYTSSIAATDRELRRAEDRVSGASGAPVAATGVASAATHAARATSSQTQSAELKFGPTGEFGPTGAAPSAIAAEPAVDDTSPWGAGAERESIVHVPSKPPRLRAAHVGVGLATLAVVAVAVLLWRSSPPGSVGPTTPTNPSVAPATTPQPSAQEPAAVAVPTPTPTPAKPPRALNIEFITIRPVWARIMIDGRRAMEREFPADQRIPLGADRTIVIRAGDAGAIRLIVDGKDLGPLGKDGQIYSRAFTAPGQ
jgi:hypothetical protein